MLGLCTVMVKAEKKRYLDSGQCDGRNFRPHQLNNQIMDARSPSSPAIYALQVYPSPLQPKPSSAARLSSQIGLHLAEDFKPEETLAQARNTGPGIGLSALA